MNRAFTVWLDLSAKAASAPPAAVPSFVLPLPLPAALTAPSAQPLTRKELLLRVLQLIWSRRGTLVALFLLWKLLRRLRALSRSTHEVKALCGPLDPALFPQYIVSPSTGLWLFTRAWRVPPADERGVVFILHAYREHIGRYEPLAAALNAAGFSVYGHDHQGHGQSGGERGFVEVFNHYVLDALHYMRTIQSEMCEAGQEPKPCFLLGHSMGGTIAMQMARVEAWRMQAEEDDQERAEEEQQRRVQARSSNVVASPGPAAAAARSPSDKQSGDLQQWEGEEQKSQHSESERSSSSPLAATPSAASVLSLAALSIAQPASPALRWHLSGLVLCNPALILDLHSVSPLLQSAASLLADSLPKAAPAGMVMDPSRLSDLSSVTAQWSADPLVTRASMPARWGAEMLTAMSDTRDACAELSLPVLLLAGRHDRYVSPAGSAFAYEHLATPAKDKTLRWFDNGTHDLWLDSCREEFTKEVVAWLTKRAQEP